MRCHQVGWRQTSMSVEISYSLTPRRWPRMLGLRSGPMSAECALALPWSCWWKCVDLLPIRNVKLQARNVEAAVAKASYANRRTTPAGTDTPHPASDVLLGARAENDDTQIHVLRHYSRKYLARAFCLKGVGPCTVICHRLFSWPTIICTKNMRGRVLCPFYQSKGVTTVDASGAKGPCFKI